MNEDQSSGKSTSGERRHNPRSTGIRTYFRRLWWWIPIVWGRTTDHFDESTDVSRSIASLEDQSDGDIVRSSDSPSEEEGQNAVSKDDGRKSPGKSSYKVNLPGAGPTEKDISQEDQGVIAEDMERNIPESRWSPWERLSCRICRRDHIDHESRGSLRQRLRCRICRRDHIFHDIDYDWLIRARFQYFNAEYMERNIPESHRSLRQRLRCRICGRNHIDHDRSYERFSEQEDLYFYLEYMERNISDISNGSTMPRSMEEEYECVVAEYEMERNISGLMFLTYVNYFSLVI
uniref:uncharacterized protein LOC120327815 n=1 Tax=Styela clava TaxID=7725 RepID=UPI00193AD89A|nr:uncharacterized protein LOC120327815 [Styela clava]